MDTTAGTGPGSVVVGVDGRGDWRRAVDWAVDEAAARRRRLVLVHVVDASEDLWRDPSGHEARIGVPATAPPGRVLLDTARAHAAGRRSDVVVTEQLLRGSVRDALTGAVGERDLLVVGARSREHLRSWLPGSASRSLARRPPCPLVVVPTRSGDSPGVLQPGAGVLVGVDDTAAAPDVLRFAFGEASLHGWALTVVHVAPELRDDIGRVARLEAERLLLAELVAGYTADHPDVAARVLVDHGEPGPTLADGTTAARLVVVGAHRGRALSDVLLGSVVVPVLRRSSCPVAVVPPAAAHPASSRRPGT